MAGRLAPPGEPGSRHAPTDHRSPITHQADGGEPAAARDAGLRRAPAAPVLALILCLAAPLTGTAQSDTTGAPGATGIEIAGLPALNYDADEGFGFGAILELYDYGREGLEPYRYTVQPKVFLTTEGRRDVTLFFDAPHLLPPVRLDAYVAREQQIATPYYGTGNDAALVEAREEDEARPYWYRFGRTRTQLRVNLQRPVGRSLRLLVGGGVAHMALTPVPRDSGTTLLAAHLADGTLPAAAADGGWSNYLRAGVIRDTRDREIGPRRGSWTELLVQRVDELLGSTTSYTRWTVADRRYFSLGTPRLVFANRFVLQGVEGDAPFYDLFVLESSFKQQEGLGGSKTVRGVLKNRYVGRGMFVWNAELRARVLELTALGRRFHVVLSGFVDSGRVWAGGVDPGTILSDLHHGVGGGVRIGMGESFIVALDVGHGAETAAAIYIGLGYLY